MKSVSQPIPFWSGTGPQGSCSADFTRDPLAYFLQPYRELGPIFRCRFRGQEVVAVGGVEANRLVWGTPELWDYYRTNAIFREQFDATYLNQLEGEAYAKKRRRTNMGFKPGVLIAHTPAMSRVLYDEVSKLPNGETDLGRFCMRILICMTGRVLLQVDLPPGLDQVMAVNNKDMLKAGSLGRWRHLWYLRPTRLLRRRRIFNFLSAVLDQREVNPVQLDDILSLILAAHPETEPPIRRQELVFDLSQLFMGGSTTTSQLILWTFLYLFQEPAWLNELRAELTHWDPFDFQSMKPWPKLRATLLEMERLRPPVPTFTRIAKQSFEFQGHRIAAGTPVLHLQTLAHFLPEFYPDPFRFQPRRFLENPDLPAREVHGTYGGGVHHCVGQPLARILPPLIVADIITRYDLIFRHRPSFRAVHDVVVRPVEKKIEVRLTPPSASLELRT